MELLTAVPLPLRYHSRILPLRLQTNQSYKEDTPPIVQSTSEQYTWNERRVRREAFDTACRLRIRPNKSHNHPRVPRESFRRGSGMRDGFLALAGASGGVVLAAVGVVVPHPTIDRC